MELEIENIGFATQNYRISIWNESVYIYPKTEHGYIRVSFKDGKIEKIEIPKEHIDELEVRE